MNKKINTLQKTILLAALLLPINVMAQDEANALIKGSPADATKLINAYFGPAFKGFGLGLNSGWATSAKTAGAFRFDLRITGTVAMSPTKDQSFDVKALNLQSLEPTLLSNTISPTLTGAKTQGVELKPKGFAVGAFRLPEGTGINYIPSPQVQLTIGLPKNIDLSLRYAPTIDFKENGKVNLFGIGAKIEVLPLILGKTGKMLPVDIAVSGGYTKVKYELPLDVNDGTNYTDQILKAELGGFSAEAIVSKKLAIFTPFASLGYNTAAHRINAFGTYDLNGSTVKDPIKIDEKSINSMKATAGFQLKLAILKLYTSYTVSEYNYFNFGIGLGTGK